MLKNVRLGIKLTGGFALVAMIVLVVGFFGWSGANQLEDHINEIGNVRMKAVESLGVIKAEANAVAAVIDTMLNPRLSGEEKAHTYEELVESRTRYETAWERYESLPATSEAIRLWTDFGDRWDSWREANNRVVTMAREVDTSGILNPDALESRLVSFNRDHHLLMENVLKLIAIGDEFEGGDDPTACAFGQWLATYSTTNPTIAALLEEVHDYHDPFHESVGEIKRHAQEGATEAAYTTFLAITEPRADDVFRVLEELESEAERVVGIYDQMNTIALGDAMLEREAATALLDDIIHLNDEYALTATDEATAAGRSVQLIALVGMVVGVAAALALGLALTRSITRPLARGVKFAEQIARGELEIELDVRQKDEIGELADSLREMLEALQYKAELVRKISEGDLRVDVELASEDDGLGASLVTMVDSLNDILGQVHVAVEQVAAGAEQVSSASQELSQGATESASSLEEISASINEINSQSTRNTESASEASSLSRQAANDAEAGQQQMNELKGAMESISDASSQIKSVVKVIDDIAFQINLLALNANVEAARAGKYGKGFAVVAEEVRNLAVRSAEAVKETAAMVEQSVSSIETGNELTDRTANQLESIVSGAVRVAQFLEEIAAASKEQALGIEQITEGLGQVDQVTQSNTASAEESASASEELSSQAQQLRSAIATFKLRSTSQQSSRLARLPASPPERGSAAKHRTSPTNGSAKPGRQPVLGGTHNALDDDEFDRF